MVAGRARLRAAAWRDRPTRKKERRTQPSGKKGLSVRTRNCSRYAILAALALAAHARSVIAQGGVAEADLIVRNALIWTGDAAQPRAQALAVRGERLIAVGTNAQVDAHRSPRTRVIDAGGRFVTPGFIDDHTHFAQAGALLTGANLLDVHTSGPF